MSAPDTPIDGDADEYPPTPYPTRPKSRRRTDSPDAPTAEWLEGALRRSGEELEVMRAERDAAVARADLLEAAIREYLPGPGWGTDKMRAALDRGTDR